MADMSSDTASLFEIEIASDTPSPTFHPFRHLPTELRLQIWKEAVLEEATNRFIIAEETLFFGVSTWYLVPSKTLVSPFLVVNTESRGEALGVYDFKLDVNPRRIDRLPADWRKVGGISLGGPSRGGLSRGGLFLSGLSLGDPPVADGGPSIEEFWFADKPTDSLTGGQPVMRISPEHDILVLAQEDGAHSLAGFHYDGPAPLGPSNRVLKYFAPKMPAAARSRFKRVVSVEDCAVAEHCGDDDCTSDEYCPNEHCSGRDRSCRDPAGGLGGCSVALASAFGERGRPVTAFDDDDDDDDDDESHVLPSRWAAEDYPNLEYFGYVTLPHRLQRQFLVDLGTNGGRGLLDRLDGLAADMRPLLQREANGRGTGMPVIRKYRPIAGDPGGFERREESDRVLCLGRGEFYDFTKRGPGTQPRGDQGLDGHLGSD